MSAHRNRRRHGDGRVRRAGPQAADEAHQNARFVRWGALERAGLGNEGRIGLSPALLNSLAIARGPDSAADLAPVVGCSPALENRPGRRVRAPSLADIVDKGALTGRVGYTHPTLAVRLRPTPGGPIVRRSWRRPGPSCGQWRIYRSHGLRPPRPMRQTTAWTRAKACGLSDPKSAGRRQKPAPAARTRRRGPFPARDDLRPPSWLPGRPWRPLRRYGWERGRPAASTPLRASRPCAP